MKSKWDRPILAVVFVLSGFLVGAVTGTEADAQTWTILTAIGTIATAVVAVWVSISQEQRIDARIQAENLERQKDSCLTVLYALQQMERVAHMMAMNNRAFRSVHELRRRIDQLLDEWRWVVRAPGHSTLINFLANFEYPCNGRLSNVLDENVLALQALKTIVDDAGENVFLDGKGFQVRAEKLKVGMTITALLCHKYYHLLLHSEGADRSAIQESREEGNESELLANLLRNDKLSRDMESQAKRAKN